MKVLLSLTVAFSLASAATLPNPSPDIQTEIEEVCKCHPENQTLHFDSLTRGCGSNTVGSKCKMSQSWSKSSIEAAYASANAHSLLCNHNGSRSEKAKEITDTLKVDYPGNHWFVNIIDKGKDWVFSQSTGEKESWHDTCGYDMLIWARSKSEITKTSCSSEEQERAKTIIDMAELTGSNYTDVMEKLESTLSLFDINTLYVSVAQKDSTWAAVCYASCQ